MSRFYAILTVLRAVKNRALLFAPQNIYTNRKPIFQSINDQNLGQYKGFAHSEKYYFPVATFNKSLITYSLNNSLFITKIFNLAQNHVN